jgi:acyl-CoA reductase-like NAD-dependent aldehyde dehydrogenase
MGIVGSIADDSAPLLGLLSQIAPVIVAGNTCVCLASQEFPYPAIVLGELLAVSDLPGGVVNILTGFRKELVPTFATHTHIRGLNAVVSQEEKKQLQLGAAESIKRVRARKRDDSLDWADDASQSVYEIRDYVEFKTTWHPIGA